MLGFKMLPSPSKVVHLCWVARNLFVPSAVAWVLSGGSSCAGLAHEEIAILLRELQGFIEDSGPDLSSTQVGFPDIVSKVRLIFPYIS